MSNHKEIYFAALGITPGDFVASEVSGAQAVDIHAIIPGGMGGRPNKDTYRIENLIALTRAEHLEYGDKQHYKDWLFKVHRKFLLKHGVTFDNQWIDEQIARYESN